MTASTYWRPVLHSQPGIGTSGYYSLDRNCIYAPSIAQDSMMKLLSDMRHAATDSIRMQVGGFVSCLFSRLSVFDNRINQPLPELYVMHDEEEFYMEWIFDYFRFGFDFFDSEEDSGWFIVMRDDAGTSTFRSKFDGDYLKPVDYALSVISNSEP